MTTSTYISQMTKHHKKIIGNDFDKILNAGKMQTVFFQHTFQYLYKKTMQLNHVEAFYELYTV